MKTISSDYIKEMKVTELSAHNYVVVFGETREGRTVRYNDNNTVQVIRVEEPMCYTESGANKVVDIYKSMNCNCVKAVKVVDWQKEIA